MEPQVVKVTELNPILEMEIHRLFDAAGLPEPALDRYDLFVRLDSTGGVLGAACAKRYENNCLLALVAVDPEQQRQGIGSMLVNHVLSHCAADCDSVYLVTKKESFFARFGFTMISLDRLPEDILRSAGREGFVEPGAVAMELVMPANWSRG